MLRGYQEHNMHGACWIQDAYSQYAVTQCDAMQKMLRCDAIRCDEMQCTGCNRPPCNARQSRLTWIVPAASLYLSNSGNCMTWWGCCSSSCKGIRTPPAAQPGHTACHIFATKRVHHGIHSSHGWSGDTGHILHHLPQPSITLVFR